MRGVRLSLLIVSLLMELPAMAQVPEVIPESANTNLYFPQFANGGPVSGQWQTIFTFANPNPSPVSANLQLMSNDGTALLMDFGTGLTNQLFFSVTPFGT